MPVIDAQDIPTTQPGAPLSDSEVECAELDEQGNDAAVDDCNSEDAQSSECDQTPFEEGEPNEQFEWLDDKFVPRSLEWPPTAPFHPKDPHYIEKMMKVVHESRVQLVGVYDSVRKEIVDALVDAELAELELERQSELTQELLNHISKVAGTNFTRHMFSWIQQDLKEEAEKDKREREAAEGTSEGSDDDGDPGNGPSGGHGYRDDSDGGGQHEDKENEHPSSRGSRHGTPPRRDPPGAGDRYDADVDSEESDSHRYSVRLYFRNCVLTTLLTAMVVEVIDAPSTRPRVGGRHRSSPCNLLLQPPHLPLHTHPIVDLFRMHQESVVGTKRKKTKSFQPS